MTEIERLQLDNQERFRIIDEGHKRMEKLTFGEIVRDTKKLLDEAIELSKEIRFYHEKAIDYSEEMLKLLDKLKGEE